MASPPQRQQEVASRSDFAPSLLCHVCTQNKIEAVWEPTEEKKTSAQAMGRLEAYAYSGSVRHGL